MTVAYYSPDDLTTMLRTGQISPRDSMAIAMREDPEGMADALDIVFQDLNRGLFIWDVLLVATTALVTYALCKSK